MFVEKLTKRDIKDFVAILNVSNEHSFVSADFITMGGINTWFVKFRNLENERRYTLCFTDFKCTSTFTNIQAKFKTFMVKKFGDEYKDAFNKNLKQQCKEEMIK